MLFLNILKKHFEHLNIEQLSCLKMSIYQYVRFQVQIS